VPTGKRDNTRAKTRTRTVPDEVLNETVALLGIRRRIRSELELATVIRKGLPTRSVESVAKRLDMTSLATVISIGLVQRTWARRVQGKDGLTPGESEKVVRLARVVARATKVFGDQKKARDWLLHASRALGGETPLSMLDTDIGANAALQELGRIDHGVFA
jgi:putative toxin-antitoxin system antitoxin component (TIGR02293 family)